MSRQKIGACACQLLNDARRRGAGVSLIATTQDSAKPQMMQAELQTASSAARNCMSATVIGGLTTQTNTPTQSRKES
jgi:phosphopantothenoylcysteine synthetase/decarboxylase